VSKKWIVVGLVFIFAGVILVARSMEPPQILSNKEWKDVSTVGNSYEVSGTFTAQEIVKLVVEPSANWLLEPAISDIPVSHVFVYVNITDPGGIQSWYELTFIQSQGGPHDVYKIRVLSGNGTSLRVLADRSSEEKAIVFRVISSGSYDAKVTSYLPGQGNPPIPPPSLTLLREETTVTTDYSQAGFLYSGVAAVLLGFFMLVWSARSSKRRRSRNRKTNAK